MSITDEEKQFLLDDIESAVVNECLGDDEKIYDAFADIHSKIKDGKNLYQFELEMVAKFLTGLCDCPEFFSEEETLMRHALAKKIME